MRRMTALLGVAAIGLWSVSTFAQAKPNFAGKWTREAPAGGAAAAGGGGGGGGARGGGGGGGRGGGGGGFACGMTCDITQDANGITVSRAAGDQTITAKFSFAGASKNSTQGPNGAVEVESTGKWDGNKFVISTTRDMGGTSITSTQTLSLEGGKLTVVTTSSREGATPQTATYTKG
jgi:hypothetical protein